MPYPNTLRPPDELLHLSSVTTPTSILIFKFIQITVDDPTMRKNWERWETQSIFQTTTRFNAEDVEMVDIPFGTALRNTDSTRSGKN
jgi:hypothetical protein